jgi:hypothetical protein
MPSFYYEKLGCMRHDIYTNNSINIFTARLRGSSYKSKRISAKISTSYNIIGDLS